MKNVTFISEIKKISLKVFQFKLKMNRFKKYFLNAKHLTEASEPHLGPLTGRCDVFIDRGASAHTYLHRGRQEGLVADAGWRAVEGADVVCLCHVVSFKLKWIFFCF